MMYIYTCHIPIIHLFCHAALQADDSPTSGQARSRALTIIFQLSICVFIEYVTMFLPDYLVTCVCVCCFFSVQIRSDKIR